MLAELARAEPIVAAEFAEADQVMTPLLGQPLTDIIFVDPATPRRSRRPSSELRQTAITQPAMLTLDIALTRCSARTASRPTW